MPLLKGFDRARTLEGDPDVVKSLHQAIASKSIDLKIPDRAIWQGDQARLKIDLEPVPFMSICRLKKQVHL